MSQNGESATSSGYEMCELTIVGQAFLWHQIRCIVAILFLIGQRREKPSVIGKLLDVDRNPRKPQYTMAAEVPLVLYDSCFDEFEELRWQTDEDDDIVRTLQSLWAQSAVRQTVIYRMLTDLTQDKTKTREHHQAECLIPGNNQSKNYKPLFERQMCESLEDRVEHFAGKKRRRLR